MGLELRYRLGLGLSVSASISVMIRVRGRIWFRLRLVLRIGFRFRPTYSRLSPLFLCLLLGKSELCGRCLAMCGCIGCVRHIPGKLMNSCILPTVQSSLPIIHFTAFLWQGSALKVKEKPET